jgi:hypothetical protein
MFKNKHAKPARSPLRRRFERTTQSAALLFFVVLGSAVYQNVSRGAPSTHSSAPIPTALHRNSVGPGEPPPREAKADAAVPANAPPSVAASKEPPPASPPPPQTKLSEEGPGTTAAIKPEPVAAVLSPVPLDCAKGSPTFWRFANVEVIDSASDRASSLVTSCRVSPVSLDACQNAVIIGVGMASTKGINATESARALRRGINLASALKKDLQGRCTSNVTVSAYVLNLGRYNDEQQRDEPDQRKVIALVATGSSNADKAAADAVVTYAKSDPKIAHYPTCELYKLDDGGRPTPVLAGHNNCGEQTGSTVSQR